MGLVKFLSGQSSHVESNRISKVTFIEIAYLVDCTDKL